MIEIEHPLNSTSRNIVWKLIGTAPGLSCWIADSVTLNGSALTFAWGDAWRHHETRQATLLKMSPYDRIRWHWNDEEEDTYVEIRMETSQMSGEITLHITDFATEDDEEWTRSAWMHNFANMRTCSGV